MREDEIPDFVDEVIATGCPMTAINDSLYVIGEIDAPDEQAERISKSLREISERYGERDHLRAEIATYLRSIGLYIELDERMIN